VASPEDHKELERFIRGRSPELLKNLPGEKKQQLFELISALGPQSQTGPQNQVIVTHQSQMTTSPVPPAELLAGYSQAFENGAERLFAMVERQSEHRQGIEQRVIDAQVRQGDRGQIFALLLALIFGGVGVYFGSIGQEWLAGTVFTTTIGGIVTTFLVNRQSQQRNLDAKAPRTPTGTK